MKIYADSSFLVRLVTREDSEGAIAEYRRLNRPPLLFLPLHGLEVRTAILQKAFFERRAVPSNERQHITRKKEQALARLEQLLLRHSFLEVSLDMESALIDAQNIAMAHTEKIGARSIDILHVTCALALEAELFITCDSRQAEIGSAEGLRVVFVEL